MDLDADMIPTSPSADSSPSSSDLDTEVTHTPSMFLGLLALAGWSMAFFLSCFLNL
jgi:hypothetical protein